MNISINPFKNVNTAKRNVVKNFGAKVSAIKNEKLRNKLKPMQNSLDYMAKHYNINFFLYELPISKECFVSCQKGKKVALSEDISTKDNGSIIAQKIYEAASKVL